MKEVNEAERAIIQKQILKLLIEFKRVCEMEGIWYSLAFGTLLGAVRHQGFIPWDVDGDVYIRYPDKEKVRQAFAKNVSKGIRLVNHEAAPKCLRSHDWLEFEEKQIVEGVHVDIHPLVGAPSTKAAQRKFAKYSYDVDRVIRSKYVDISQCKKKNRPLVLCAKIIDFFIPDRILRQNICNRETRYDYENADYLISLMNYGKASCCMPKRLFYKMKSCTFEGEDFAIPARPELYLKRMYGDDYMIPKKDWQ